MSGLSWSFPEPGSRALALVEVARRGKPHPPWVDVTHKGHAAGVRVRLERAGSGLVLVVKSPSERYRGDVEAVYLPEFVEDLPDYGDAPDSPRWSLWCAGCGGEDSRNAEQLLRPVLEAYARWLTGGETSSTFLPWS